MSLLASSLKIKGTRLEEKKGGLRQVLLDDFGKNLPVDRGFGASVDDPIRARTSNPFQAA